MIHKSNYTFVKIYIKMKKWLAVGFYYNLADKDAQLQADLSASGGWFFTLK